MLNNLWRCQIQTDNLEKLIFANKKCPSDRKAGCKSAFSLIEFIEIDGSLWEELEEFEVSFEKDEIVEPWKWKKNLLF